MIYEARGTKKIWLQLSLKREWTIFYAVEAD